MKYELGYDSITNDVFQCSRAQEKRKEHIGGGQEVVTGESHWKLKDTYDFARKGSGRDAPPPTTV